MYQLGNNEIKISKNFVSEDTKRLHYHGAFWLMHSRDNKLKCSMNIEAISRFIIFKLGLSIAAVKIATRKSNLLNLDNYKDVKVEIFMKNPNDEIIFTNLNVYTEMFGLLRSPTREEMLEFLEFSKM